MSGTTRSERILLLAVLLLLSLIPRVSAGTWLYPLPNTNPNYNRTDTLNATWATTFHEPYMVLWCQAPGASISTAGWSMRIALGVLFPDEDYRIQRFNFQRRVVANRPWQIRPSELGMLPRGD